ncbi:MAG: RagB/SusD family nutrient uptake outer membrane protein [Thalassobius sp.]|nr:RagB/SusD family nutrient uptake outer membrane protein [Thalassovita sp.]
MKRIFLNYKMVLIALLFATACNDLDLAPTNKFTEENYWTSTDKAETVLNTAYMDMTRSNYFFFNEALSDNAYMGRGDSDNVKTISSGQQDPATSRFGGEWNMHYAGIKTCNVFLQNVDRVPDIEESHLARLKAECRFIRAFHYFQLTSWFGDVPLFAEDISLEDSKTIGRTSHSEVVDFVLTELEESAAVLPTNNEYADTERGRITKGAAIALMARVHLYESDWQQVATTTEQLMNGNTNGTYELFSSYNGIFQPENEYNNEVILDHQYVPVYRTYSALFDLAPLSVGARVNTMAPTQELVDNYIMMNGKAIDEDGSGYDEADPYSNRDPRLSSTVVYNMFEWEKADGSTQTIYIEPGSAPDESAARDEYEPGGNSTSTGYYLRKYYDPTSQVNFQSGLNLILIRYADVLLMYAEAKNEMNEMSESVWNTTIRALRERAGFTDPGALTFNSSWSQDELREIIRNERRSELAMEGLRIFDILRWKTAEDVLNGYPHGAKFGEEGTDNGYIRLEQRVFDPNKHYLWPIPRAERDLNPNLGQNPGWGS